MSYDFSRFKSNAPDEAFVDWLVNERIGEIARHFNRFWRYYQNPICSSSASAGLSGEMSPSGRNYIQAQETGLPPRITGVRYGIDESHAQPMAEIERKEVVIENDIA